MRFDNDISLAGVELFALQVDNGVSPKMALGTMPKRPALLIRVVDADGCFGWGEIWANFPPRAHIHKAHLVEDVVAPKLKRAQFTEPREIIEQLRKSLAVYFLHIGQCQVFEHILAGLDTALWDLALRKANISFARFMGLSEARAKTYASSINTEDLEHLLPLHASYGQTHFKIKIGFLNEKDQGLVERASSQFTDESRMMVDSNQMWDLPHARTALHSLEAYNPLFAEESLPANSPLEEWEALAASTTIALAGGENIYGIDNFLAMANAGLRVLQPDVAKWGGVTGALDLAGRLPTGVVLWPHFMGSAIGQMAALSVAAAIGDSSVCELDVNTNGLRTELCGDVMKIQQGCVPIVDDCGLVHEPDTAFLGEYMITA